MHTSWNTLLCTHTHTPVPMLKRWKCSLKQLDASDLCLGKGVQQKFNIVSFKSIKHWVQHTQLYITYNYAHTYTQSVWINTSDEEERVHHEERGIDNYTAHTSDILTQTTAHHLQQSSRGLAEEVRAHLMHVHTIVSKQGNRGKQQVYITVHFRLLDTCT